VIGGSPDERLERRRVDRVAFVEVNGAPNFSFETGVEEARRILEEGTLGERDFDRLLIGLSRTDQPIVRPDRDTPLPFFDDFRIGFNDKGSNFRKNRSAPVGELLDAGIDPLRWGCVLRKFSSGHGTNLRDFNGYFRQSQREHGVVAPNAGSADRSDPERPQGDQVPGKVLG